MSISQREILRVEARTRSWHSKNSQHRLDSGLDYTVAWRSAITTAAMIPCVVKQATKLSERNHGQKLGDRHWGTCSEEAVAMTLIVWIETVLSADNEE